VKSNQQSIRMRLSKQNRYTGSRSREADGHTKAVA